MARHNLNDLVAFVNVAREGSFTKAAALLGVTQSALSQAVSGLEKRLNIRLLTRTTRSISVTPAGEHLLATIGLHLDEIEDQLQGMDHFRDSPSGTVRISCGDHVIQTILLPKLAPVLLNYPDITVEFNVDYGFCDIVADRFDAGVRFGETLNKDMIALPIGPRVRMAAVAAPGYFEQHTAPATPRDLAQHSCINIRFPTYGGLDVWEFEQDGRAIKVRVTGQLIFNSTVHVAQAALAGLGIAYLPEDEFSPYLADGRLTRVLEAFCPPFDGYHLYYPSRRQPSPAFSLVLSALRQ
jgi:DNA-binding transcriptional LysR family regulator